jgi:hypothetical protein
VVGVATEYLKRHKSPGINQIPTEMIEIGGKMLCSDVQKLVNSIWNKEKLTQQWKEYIIVSICKICDKTNCSNNKGISLLPTTYKTLSIALISK